jgi:OmpA-OmpF porin, OOP family
MKLDKYLLVLTCALAATAHAESNWYLAGSIGQSSFDASKSDGDASLNDVGLGVNSSSLDDEDTAYKIQLGYQFNPNFAIEGGYVDLGGLTYKANVTDGIFDYNAKMDVEASGLNIAAVGILPLNDNFSLFAKFGFINAKVETTVKVSSGGFSSSGSEDSTDLKPMFGIGAAYSITDQLAIRVELERYSKLGDEDSTGEGDVDLLSGGILFKF